MNLKKTDFFDKTAWLFHLSHIHYSVIMQLLNSFSSFSIALTCFVCWQLMSLIHMGVAAINNKFNVANRYAVFARHFSSFVSFFSSYVVMLFASFYIFHWTVGSFFLYVFHANLITDVKQYLAVMEYAYQSDMPSPVSFIEYRMNKYCSKKHLSLKQ